VFGLFEESGRVQPVCVGLYPEWQGPGARPQVYRTPVGEAAFAHVARVEGTKLAHVLDDDGQGFVLVAAIPRTAIPRVTQPFAGGFRTMIDFEATLGGHDKFWWANSDGSASRETFDEPTEARLYPGSWAPARFQGLDSGVLVRHWLVCGPWGGPEAERFSPDPNGKMPGTNIDWKEAVRQFCEAAEYPPDSGKVDRDAVFRGEQLRGYWHGPRELRWQPATVADLDTRVHFGPSGQVWYAASWIYVPNDVELEFQFQGHPMTPLRWRLNDRAIDLKFGKERHGDSLLRCLAIKTLTLHRGWNQVMVRGYGFGYPPARAGLVLSGPAEKLWTLRLSATPPK
jgi:hypothetical protein